MSGNDAKPGDKGLSIQILGRDYRVACPEGEEQQVGAAVEFLNRRMKELRDTGRITGNERIAVMAALNLAHELLAQKPAKAGSRVDDAVIRRRIEVMQETLDSRLMTDDIDEMKTGIADRDGILLGLQHEEAACQASVSGTPQTRLPPTRITITEWF